MRSCYLLLFVMGFVPLITADHRRRAREIFGDALRESLPAKTIAGNAGLKEPEVSRQMSGEHNLAAELLVAQPEPVQIKLALMWLVKLGAIPDPNTRSLRHAARLQLRMARAQLDEPIKSAKEA